MDHWKLALILLSFLLNIAFCDLSSDGYTDGYTVDKYPNNGVNPEKPLPNDNVYDSHEPRDIEPEPDWKYTINTIVSIAAIAQVVILLCYILVSRACCITIKPPRFGDDYPLKPWSVQNERTYDLSERRYLSKDDAIPSDVMVILILILMMMLKTWKIWNFNNSKSIIN